MSTVLIPKIGAVGTLVQSQTDSSGATVLVGAGGVRSALQATGNDQSTEIEQYINDTGGSFLGSPDFGVGEFIIGSDVIVHPRASTNMDDATYWWANDTISRSLSFRGMGPGLTVFKDVRSGTTTPAIKIAQENANYGTMQNTRVGGFTLLRCNTTGIPVVEGAEAGQGIWFSKEIANQLGVTHDGIIEDVQIAGFTNALSINDCTQLKLSRVMIPTAGGAGIRLGYNIDQLIVENVYGGWGYGAGNYKNEFWLIETGWADPDDSTFTAGTSNMIKLDRVYCRNNGGMLHINGTTDTQFELAGVAIEQARQFIKVTGVCNPRIYVRDWQIGGTVSNNDDADYPKFSIASTAAPLLALTGGKSGGATLAPTVVIGADATVEWNNNSVVAPSGYYLSLIAINAAGTGYTANDILSVAGGTTGQTAKIKVLTVGGSGEILTAEVNSVGQYSVNPTTTANAVTGGTGSSATFNLTMVTTGHLNSRKASYVTSRTIPQKSSESSYSLKMSSLDWDTSGGVQPHANPIAKISGDEIRKFNYADVSGTITLSKLEADVYFYNALADNITFDMSSTDGAAFGDRIKIVIRQKSAVGAKTVSFTAARMKADVANASGIAATATQRAFYEFECIGTNMWQQVSPAAVWYS